MQAARAGGLPAQPRGVGRQRAALLGEVRAGATSSSPTVFSLPQMAAFLWGGAEPMCERAHGAVRWAGKARAGPAAAGRMHRGQRGGTEGRRRLQLIAQSWRRLALVTSGRFALPDAVPSAPSCRFVASPPLPAAPPTLRSTPACCSRTTASWGWTCPAAATSRTVGTALLLNSTLLLNLVALYPVRVWGWASLPRPSSRSSCAAALLCCVLLRAKGRPGRHSAELRWRARALGACSAWAHSERAALAGRSLQR